MLCQHNYLERHFERRFKHFEKHPIDKNTLLRHTIPCIPLCLEALAFIVSNEVLQWTFAFSGLLGAFIIFKKYMPDAYASTKSAICLVLSCYKWKNLKALVFCNPDGIASRFLWFVLLLEPPLCIVLMIVEIIAYFLR